MGAATLKNIAESVRHYRVRLDGSEPVAAQISVHPVARRRHKSFAAWLIVIILAVGLGIAGWRATTPETPRPSGPPSLAVLPFTAIGGGDAQKAFGAGLTADLITSLSSKPDIRVLTGGGKAGAKSSAQYLFEGSVRGTDKIRITAQLIDARTGFHLWGGRYDRVLTDPLEQQAEVSAKIVATLNEKLTAMRRAQAESETGSSEGGGVLMTGLAFIGRVAEAAIGFLAGLFG
jgi:TolB-like protein